MKSQGGSCIWDPDDGADKIRHQPRHNNTRASALPWRVYQQLKNLQYKFWDKFQATWTIHLSCFESAAPRKVVSSGTFEGPILAMASLPPDLMNIICEELAGRREFGTLFRLCLSGKQMAGGALWWLYR